ncbi:MAG: amidohydrolase family protein [Polyangiaceae bacterium]
MVLPFDHARRVEQNLGLCGVVTALALVLAACDVGVADGSLPLPVPRPENGGAGLGGSGPGPGGAGGTTSSTGGAGGDATGGMNVGGGGGGQGACDGGGPVVETDGSDTRYLLKGILLLPSSSLDGEILIDGNTIVCVAASCANHASAAGATVIDTHGVIAPGLIDGHNHILFDIMDEDDWVPMQVYQNHNQWTNEARYGAMVDTKQYLAGESGSPVDYACELDKYGETKALIAGTTAVQGSPGGSLGNKQCYGSISRTIDQTPNGLPADKMQTSTLFPSTSSADGVCTNFNDGDTNCYVVHVGEGVDQTSRNEFTTLGTVSTTDFCLYDSRTTIIHGTALDNSQIAIMGANAMSLVWSPRSNVFLYGGGTDLSKTTNIPEMLAQGVNVAIAPDWSMGGSQNMLDELRFADQVDNAQFGNILDAKTLVEMATINAARAMGVSQYLGSLEVGKRADIAVFLPSSDPDPYRAVLDATPREVTLVFVDGRLLYGDADLEGITAANARCELAPVDVCCRSKFLCVGVTGAANGLDQTLGEFSATLENALEAYDAMDLTQWDFAPITPIVKCP